MAITIKKLAVSADKPINRKILIYGDSNSGKTFLAGTAQDCPELSDVLVANLDGGATTLLSRGDVREAEGVRGSKDVEELLWMMARKDPAVANIKTLVLDGSSELAKVSLAEIAAAEVAKPNAKRKDVDQAELLDYSKLKNRLLRIFRMARDLPDITLILTAWATKTYPGENKQADPNAIFPDLTMSVRNTLIGYMDDCWYISHDQKTDKRYLYTGSLGPVFAKTRDAAVAAQLTTEGKPYIVNPTFKDIYTAYKRAYGVK